MYELNPVGHVQSTLTNRADAIAAPTRFKVLDLEAFDGTPILDVKPVLDRERER